MLTGLAVKGETGHRLALARKARDGLKAVICSI